MSIGAYPDFLDEPGIAEKAACRGYDTDIFFPKAGDDGTYAKAICAVCPIEAICRDWALAQRDDDVYGVWGGLSQLDRKRINRRRRAKDEANRDQTCQDCGVFYGNFIALHRARIHGGQAEVAA